MEQRDAVAGEREAGISLTTTDMPGDTPEAALIKAKIRAAWERELQGRKAAADAIKEGADLRRELAALKYNLKAGEAYIYRDGSGENVGILEPHNDFHLLAVRKVRTKSGKAGKSIMVVRHLDALVRAE